MKSGLPIVTAGRHRRWLSKGLAVVAICYWTSTALPVSLTVTPNTVTNDYVGKITLSITGLTTGETVRAGEYADLNNNGTVEEGEPLMQAGGFTDGFVRTFGEPPVRNLNVRGDEDGATNGEMRVELFFPGVDAAMGRFEGNFLSLVRSSSNVVVQPFVVRQKVFLQGIRGQVTDAATGAPLTNASVLLLSGAQGIGLTGTFLNTNGHFTLYTEPGSYRVVALQDGYAANWLLGPVTVVTNQFATNDVAIVPGTNLVTGTVTPMGTNTTGLPAVGVMAQRSNGDLAYAWTDRNGNYSMKLNSGEWNFSLQSTTLARLGFLCQDKEVTTNITGPAMLNFQVPVANALIWGRVQDEKGDPVVGVEVRAYNDDQTLVGRGMSYPTDGAYTVGVQAGSGEVDPSVDIVALMGYVSAAAVPVTTDVGQTTNVDFRVRRITAHVSGFVRDNHGLAVTQLRLQGSTHIGTNDFLFSARTDANGYYQTGLCDGRWVVRPDCYELWEGGYGSPPEQSVTVNGSDVVANFRLLAPGSPPEIVAPTALSDGNFRFTVLAVPGHIYEVQTCLDLTKTNWISHSYWTNLTSCCAGCPSDFYGSWMYGGPQGFYRVIMH